MIIGKNNGALVVNLFGGPGVGKCFLKGTKVIMYDGSIKKVEDVLVGDKLMGPDGKPRIVLNLSSGIDTIYEIKPVKGASHYVNGNHVLPLKLNHHGKEKDEKYSVNEFMKLSEWRKGRLKLQRANAIPFKEKEVPIDPYFIGCWLGDGNNANQGITSIDNEIIHYLKDMASNFDMSTNTVTKTGTDAVRVDITNGQCGGKPNTVLNILRDLNVINNKHIPDIYKINSENYRLRLLAGLIDTDGSLSNKCYEITTKYEILKDDILFLVRSLGLAAYSKEKTVNNVVYNRIFISGEIDKVPVLLPRKKPEKRTKTKNVLRVGFEVTNIGKEVYYGFEVNEDHLFLLDDFTVTHNSTTAAGVFTLLKLHDAECELVTEYAKDLVWEERHKTFYDQQYIFAKQNHRLWRVHDKVDIVVTDCPLMLSPVYGRLYDTTDEVFDGNVACVVNKYNNVNILLQRTKKYNQNGRNQTEDQAKEIDKTVRSVLASYCMAWTEIPGNFEGINNIFSLITSKEPKFKITLGE